MPLWGQPDHTTRQERNQRCNPVKRRVEPCLFSALPEDVLVMEIFSYLGVEEIICLRRVSHLFYPCKFYLAEASNRSMFTCTMSLIVRTSGRTSTRG